ncbi:MAG: hypothetical protein ACI87W_003368 [Halieaceae bacterium]|jgi:hypothetical protein
MNKSMKKSMPLLVLLAIGAALWEAYGPEQVGGVATLVPDTVSAGNATLERAYREHRSDVQVQGEGRVVKVLADDTRGSQHQRFLLEIPSGLTLLVAHNIDLAPRIARLSEGDLVGFYGEYEWNDRGGVIHWTHHDPRGKHAGGWLEHRGERYD